MEELGEVKERIRKIKLERRNLGESLTTLYNLIEEGKRKREELDRELHELLVKEAELEGKVVLLPPRGERKRKRKVRKSNIETFDEFWEELSRDEQALIVAILKEKEEGGSVY